MDNLDLKTLSANLSCAQMTDKAKDEINYYNYRFDNIMTLPNCIDNYSNTNNFNTEDDNDYDNNNNHHNNNHNNHDNNHDNNKMPKINNNTNVGYLPSLTINKRTCMVKKDFYNEGKWIKQFDDNLNINDVFFDKQTKNKVSNKLPNII